MAEPQWITQLFEDMILVEGGSFWMGNDDFILKRERPRHQVELSTFQIAKHPVTEMIWDEVNSPSLFKEMNFVPKQVSWDDICKARGFLDKLNKILAIAGMNAKEGKKFRLPTEAQWEYAARGGQEAAKGNLEFAGSNNLKEVGWYGKNSHEETKPVGLKLPNNLGIYDMSGNVWEWCADIWHKDYNHVLNNGWEYNGIKNLRVIRGGSRSRNLLNSRVANRDSRDAINQTCGFRLVRY